MSGLACGVRGCWPIRLRTATTTTTTTTTENSMQTVGSIEQLLADFNPNIALAICGSVLFLIVIITACRLSRLQNEVKKCMEENRTILQAVQVHLGDRRRRE